MVGPVEQVCGFLPGDLSGAIHSLPEWMRAELEELRLRVGRRPSVLCREGERELPDVPEVKTDDLLCILELASQYSAHVVLNRMENGFVALPGGHRIGLCGVVRVENQIIKGFDFISSMNIRFAREKVGLARSIIPQLTEGRSLKSALILAPPGAGKTTLLRDMIRCLSDGECSMPFRIGVVDERSELGGCWNGVPQMSLGKHTDLMDGAPKADALYMLLRGMNPQVLAVDEISKPEDVDAICQAAGCGVNLLATAHARDLREMMYRPVYRELLRQNIFRAAVVISRDGEGKRIMKVEEITCCDW